MQIDETHHLIDGNDLFDVDSGNNQFFDVSNRLCSSSRRSRPSYRLGKRQKSPLRSSKLIKLTDESEKTIRSIYTVRKIDFSIIQNVLTHQLIGGNAFFDLKREKNQLFVISNRSNSLFDRTKRSHRFRRKEKPICFPFESMKLTIRSKQIVPSIWIERKVNCSSYQIEQTHRRIEKNHPTI